MDASTTHPGSRALRRGRCSLTGQAYLVTTVTDQRIPWFQVFSFAALMCRSLNHPDCLRDAEALCWVLMPDHLHLLLVLDDAGLSTVMKSLKARSAILLNREIGRRGRFWESGFHDRALRREEDLLTVARYIVGNPLRAGLVKRVADYPYWNAAWL